MKFRAMIRGSNGVVRTHKVRLKGGVFKTRIDGKKIVLGWDREKSVPHEKRFVRWQTRYMSFYDSDAPGVPLNPPFDGADVLPDTNQTRALKHLSEYAESRAIEALGKGPLEIFYVLVFMLAAAVVDAGVFDAHQRRRQP